MAQGINKVIIVGNLGKDPETRYMPSGAAVTNVTIATSESWKNKDTGQREERTEWHRVVFFGKLAEIAGEFLKKGSKVYVEGKLRTRSYDKDGQKHYATEIVADVMQMLDSRGGEAGPTHSGDGFDEEPGRTAHRPGHGDSGRTQQAQSVGDDFDEIPF